jgi:hypothetical protein
VESDALLMFCQLGQYIGTGAELSIALGYEPDAVMLDPGGTIIRIRGKSMPVNTMMALTHGQGSYITNVNQFKTIDATGFTVGSGLSVLGNTYTYIALKNDTLIEIATTTWSGNAGLDNRSITGIGFQPDVVAVSTNGAFAFDRYWHKNRGGDSSAPFNETQFWIADHIQGVGADGFTVGTSYNQAGTNYAAFCIRDGLNCETGIYSGDGSGNRVIPLSTLTNPAFCVMATRNTGGSNISNRGPYRHRYNSVGKGYQIGSIGEITQSITAFSANSFTVDTLWNPVNLDAYYLAFSELIPPSNVPEITLPEIPGGGAGSMLPFAPYNRYKTLRALGSELNNLVLGP